MASEILDGLDADHPDARASRRDLHRINQLMGNYRWFVRALDRSIPPSRPLRFLEMGAGSPHLARAILRGRAVASYTAVDTAPEPPDWPDGCHWEQGDARRTERFAATDVVLANLVLHHFADPDLAALGGRMAAAGVGAILASEPARRGLHLAQMGLTRPLGFNHVTHHDARASIRAGFLGNELAVRLGLDPRDWRIEARTTFLGAYRLCALRR